MLAMGSRLGESLTVASLRSLIGIPMVEVMIAVLIRSPVDRRGVF